jgi:acetoin utilization protein AcuB
MLVRDCMTPNPTTVRMDSDPMAAQTLMRYGKLRRLPVLDENDCLVGIVTTSDLNLFFSTAPSPGVAKRQYRVDQVMTSPVVTVSPDYPLEEAAELMRQTRVTGLPVVEGEKLVGIITAGDILALLVESMGGHISASLRVTVQVLDLPGQLARVANKLADLNCNICSMLSVPAGEHVKLTMRLRGVDHAAVLQAIQELEDVMVVHMWEHPETDASGT